MDDNASQFVDAFITWAKLEPGIATVALVGSHARGEASPDSDIDLLIIGDQSALLADTSWILRFGTVQQFAIEEYGEVTSLRVHYEGGMEVEYGLASPSWTATPLDAGSADVIRSGIKVLWDPQQEFSKAIASVAS